jgi:cysteine-rich repeat protein
MAALAAVIAGCGGGPTGEDAAIAIDAAPDAAALDAPQLDAGLGTCGDDRVEETESCDDGNLDPGDGCGPTCARGPRTCDDALDLATVATSIGPRAWRYTFASRTDAFHSPFRGEGCGEESYAAVLLRTTADVDGALIVEPHAFGSSNSLIAVLGACDDPLQTLACGAQGSTSARVRAGAPIFIGIHPGDPPYDFDIRFEPFAAAGSACNFFTQAICGPPLVCAEPLVCADACGDGAVDIGEECDDGARGAGDGCAPDCTLETQVLDGLSCAPAPTPLVFSPGRDGTVVALAEGDTSASTARDPSCLDPGEASPTIYVSLDVPAGASASISALGEDGFAPYLRLVTAACGVPFSCRLGRDPGPFDVIDDIIGPGLRTVAISGARGPGDRGRLRVRASICADGRLHCPL